MYRYLLFNIMHGKSLNQYDKQNKKWNKSSLNDIPKLNICLFYTLNTLIPYTDKQTIIAQQKFHPPLQKIPQGLFLSNFFKTQLNLYKIVGLMQKYRVRSPKLRKLRNFEILVRNSGKKTGRKERSITRSNVIILNSNFLQLSSFFKY